jgi:hypothetical protein
VSGGDEIGKKLSLFLAGGTIYPSLEILCRGKTDFSMALAGGICLCLIDGVCNSRLRMRPLAVKCFAGSGIITSVEFATGILVNLVLKLNVWDYSQLPMNILGQICLPFSLLWFFLTIPALRLCVLYDRVLEKAKTQSNDLFSQERYPFRAPPRDGETPFYRMSISRPRIRNGMFQTRFPVRLFFHSSVPFQSFFREKP